jgi:hypothetical protein
LYPQAHIFTQSESTQEQKQVEEPQRSAPIDIPTVRDDQKWKHAEKSPETNVIVVDSIVVKNAQVDLVSKQPSMTSLRRKSIQSFTSSFPTTPHVNKGVIVDQNEEPHDTNVLIQETQVVVAETVLLESKSSTETMKKVRIKENDAEPLPSIRTVQFQEPQTRQSLHIVANKSSFAEQSKRAQSMDIKTPQCNFIINYSPLCE